MTKILLLISFLIISTSCVSTRNMVEEDRPLVDVLVQEWMHKHNANSPEKLPVIIQSKGALEGYDFLKMLKENFYGGQATYADLKRLEKDAKVLRIYTGRQKLLK